MKIEVIENNYHKIEYKGKCNQCDSILQMDKEAYLKLWAPQSELRCPCCDKTFVLKDVEEVSV